MVSAPVNLGYPETLNPSSCESSFEAAYVRTEL